MDNSIRVTFHKQLNPSEMVWYVIQAVQRQVVVNILKC